MGFRDRHKGLLLAGATTLVGLLVVDAYRSIKRNNAEQQAELARLQRESLAKQESDRYKIGVDPDAVELLARIRGNDHYRRGIHDRQIGPPDVPAMAGSGIFNGEYGAMKTVESPYVTSSKN